MIKGDLIMNKKELNYSCPLCGEHYETPTELAHCILACEEKKRVEEEKKKVEELKAAKDARKKEVDEAFDKWTELRKAYEKDYGNYSITRNYVNEFPWNLFWN